MNLTDAINYISNECDNWQDQAFKTSVEDALTTLQDINAGSEAKQTAMEALDTAYWDCTEVSNQLVFGQSVFTVSYSTDPVRPFPVKKPA